MRAITIISIAAAVACAADLQGASAQCVDEPIYTWEGVDGNDLFGDNVSPAGDVNGDGFDDVIVGSQFASENGAYSGSAYVFSGASGELLYSWHGEDDGLHFGDYFGCSVSGAGDVNADGFDDVIVGAFGDGVNGDNSGSAFVYSGATGEPLYVWHGDKGHDELGASVSGAGDVNGDGFDDVVVGAHGDDVDGNPGIPGGTVFVFSGATGEVLFSKHGDSLNALLLGNPVGGAGDVNADGFDDVIVGAGPDSAFVFSGKSGEVLHAIVDYVPWFGNSVSGAGDVNGDGFDDFIVGAVMNSPDEIDYAGSAYVFSGATGEVLHEWHGENPYDFVGVAVSGAGDVNDDGFDDVIVGTQVDYGDNVNAGSAMLLSGLTGELLHVWYGSEGDVLGRSVSGPADVNGDGSLDLIVGAPLVDGDSGRHAGAAYVFTLDCKNLCPADIVGDDGQVETADLLALLAAWGPCEDCTEDITGDGSVGTDDLLQLLAAWGPCE